eukprot:4482125-Pyramimonas_sp.AAC.1
MKFTGADVGLTDWARVAAAADGPGGASSANGAGGAPAVAPSSWTWCGTNSPALISGCCCGGLAMALDLAPKPSMPRRSKRDCKDCNPPPIEVPVMSSSAAPVAERSMSLANCTSSSPAGTVASTSFSDADAVGLLSSAS